VIQQRFRDAGTVEDLRFERYRRLPEYGPAVLEDPLCPLLALTDACFVRGTARLLDYVDDMDLSAVFGQIL